MIGEISLFSLFPPFVSFSFSLPSSSPDSHFYFLPYLNMHLIVPSCLFAMY